MTTFFIDTLVHFFKAVDTIFWIVGCTVCLSPFFGGSWILDLNGEIKEFAPWKKRQERKKANKLAKLRKAEERITGAL